MTFPKKWLGRNEDCYKLCTIELYIIGCETIEKLKPSLTICTSLKLF